MLQEYLDGTLVGIKPFIVDECAQVNPWILSLDGIVPEFLHLVEDFINYVVQFFVIFQRIFEASHTISACQ